MSETFVRIAGAASAPEPGGPLPSTCAPPGTP